MFLARGFVFSGLRRLPPKYLTSRVPPARGFSLSPYRQAAEISTAQAEALEALKNSETFQKISRSPTALSAIQKLTEVMQKSGIEPGTKPSTVQMLKLATNSEFRQASKTVSQEFQNAGVDLTSKDVMEELQSIASAIFTTPTPKA